MKIGDLIKYKSRDACIGVVLKLGPTMAKVRWHDEEIVEWMPYYSLEIIQTSEQ